MCNSGNVLFRSWKATFDCDSTASAKVIVDFGIDEDHLLKSGHTDVREQIANLCEFFETSLDEWMNHVAEKRTAYMNLNYFTTEQLVILRQEMAKLAHKGTDIDNRIYHLLYFVKPSCSEADIRKAWQTTSRELNEVEQEMCAVPASSSAAVDTEVLVNQATVEPMILENMDIGNGAEDGDCAVNAALHTTLKTFTASLLDDSKQYR
jgi:hypothetical protein